MTAETDVDRRLRALYHATADPGVVPGQMGRVMAATATVAQRRGPWARLHRTGSGARTRSVVFSRRTAMAFAVVLIALAVVAFAASRPRPPAGRGLLAFVQNGDLMFADRDGHNAVPVLRGRGLTITGPVWSPDGRRVVVGGLGDGLVAIDAATLATTRISSSPVAAFAWSPDGAQVAVLNGTWYDSCWPSSVRFGRGCDESAANTSLDLVDVRTGTSTRIAGPFPAAHLAWSPDGHWIAASVYGRLTLVDPVTRDQQIVVDGNQLHGTDWPAWSPDSQRLAFEHLDCTTGRQGCSRALAVVGLDGSAPADLTDYGGWQPKPAWSPAGTWIAYEIDVRDLPVADGQSGESLPGLALIHPDGTGQRVVEVRPVHDWAWDPDGAGLSYTAPTEVGQSESRLLRLVAATGETSEIGLQAGPFGWQPTRPRSRATDLPSPVPDTDPILTLAAVTTPAPVPMAQPSTGAVATLVECDLHAFDLSTSEVDLTSVPDCMSLPQAPQLSPDGRALLVQDAGGPAVLRAHGRIDLGPADPTEASFGWSADGRWLVRQDCLAAGDCRWSILTTDGRTVRSFPTQINWTDDGSRTWTWVEQPVANGPSEGDVAVGGPDGSGLVQIGRFPAPLWSPHGERFAFAREGDVWVAAADGSDARPITTFGNGDITSIAWSAAGDRLVFSRGSSVWIATLDGSAPRRLDIPRGTFYQAAWSPDGRQLALAGTADTESYDGDLDRLYLIDVDRGTASLLRAAENPIWSPDGRYLLIDHVGSRSGEVSVDIVNADGSGRRMIATAPSLSAKAWVR